MKVSTLGKSQGGNPRPPQNKPSLRANNAPNKNATKGSGSTPQAKKYRTLVRTVNKNLNTLNPTMKASTRRTYAKGAAKMLGNVVGRFNQTQP